MSAQMKKQVRINNRFFEVDIVNEQIVGSEHHFKLTRKTSTPQYEELMALMALHPTFGLLSVAPKNKVEKKQTYEGLTLKLIKQWVNIMGTDQQKMELANLVEDKRSYPTIKSWFLDSVEFVSVNKLVRDIQGANLAEAKFQAKRVRVVKKAAQGASATEAEASNSEILSVKVIPQGVPEE